MGEIPPSDIPEPMKIWRNSVIHFEGAQNIEQVQNRIRRLSTPGQDNASIGGAAVFIEHQRKHYLLTSRDVVHDSILARQIRQGIENSSSNALALEIRSSKDLSAEAEAQAAIYQILFRIPSLQELKGNGGLASPAFLMGLGESDLASRAYTFSDSDLNLAVISLNRSGSRFAEDLLKSGYKPVSSTRIGQPPSSSDLEIFTVGYPVMTALSSRLNVAIEEAKWAGALASVPTYSCGYIVGFSQDDPVFECEFAMNIANSGGPVIENNMLIGLLQKPILNTKTGEVAWQSVKASGIWKLLTIQARKDSIFTIKNR